MRGGIGAFTRRLNHLHVLLDSLVAFAGVHDTVVAEKANALTLAVEGPFAAALSAEADNLVLRAARALADAAGVRPWAALRLVKRLPVASGIGGGSADAAAALLATGELWRVTHKPGALAKLALKLGADVPVCLEGKAAQVGGIGEKIDPAPPLPRAPLVLVNPLVPLPTPAVFKARSGPFSKPAPLASAPRDARDLAEALARAATISPMRRSASCPRSEASSRRSKRSPAASSRACRAAAPPASRCSRARRKRRPPPPRCARQAGLVDRSERTRRRYQRAHGARLKRRVSGAPRARGADAQRRLRLLR